MLIGYMMGITGEAGKRGDKKQRFFSRQVNIRFRGQRKYFGIWKHREERGDQIAHEKILLKNNNQIT